MSEVTRLIYERDLTSGLRGGTQAQRVVKERELTDFRPGLTRCSAWNPEFIWHVSTIVGAVSSAWDDVGRWNVCSRNQICQERTIRLPRLRFTVRRMMVAVAVVGISLVLLDGVRRPSRRRIGSR